MENEFKHQTYMDRDILLTAQVGSVNYNLHTASSDADYKTFVLPTFEDLYYGKRFSSSTNSEKEDNTYHDIRQLTHLFFKANINFLEVLFSVNTIVTTKEPLQEFILNLVSHREEIARMNLPYLYDACIGMSYQKEKSLWKPTETTQELFDKVGYDAKDYHHAYRVLDFLERYQATGFESFHDAIWYPDASVDKDVLLYMKQGRTPKDGIVEDIHWKRERVEKIKDSYKEAKPDITLKSRLDMSLYNLVKNTLK